MVPELHALLLPLALRGDWTAGTSHDMGCIGILSIQELTRGHMRIQLSHCPMQFKRCLTK